MKFKTGVTIEKVVPYATAIFAGLATFAAMRLYSQFCEELGMDLGIEGTIDTMQKI